MDELILAFALKFENNAPVILQRLFEGTPVSVEEIDEILKKVEEKYVVITSDDYPDFFIGSIIHHLYFFMKEILNYLINVITILKKQ